MIRHKHIFLLALATVAAGSLTAQTAILGVVNAASQAPPGAPNNAIAPGAQFTILGSGLGPDQGQQVSDFPYPTTDGLAGVTVKATIGGTSLDCIVISVAATSVTAVLPSTAPTGTGTVTVSYQASSATANITVVAANPGLFTTVGTASGLASASVVNDDGTTMPVTPGSPARPGQKVVLLATGLGAVSGDEAGGPVTADLPLDVMVMVGGKSANVIGKGRAGLAPGVDQITIEVPSGLNSCSVPVAVRAGGYTSNFVSLPVAANGPCPDFVLSPDDEQRIIAQGEFRSGGINLGQSSLSVQGFDITSESASAGFFDVKLNGVITGQYQVGQNATLGSCVVTVVSTALNPNLRFDIRSLDAGSSLTLSGPKGDRPMTKQNDSYGVMFPQSIPIPGAPPAQTYFDAGDYTVTGPGGADVGPFTAKLTIGPALNWTNRSTAGNAGNDTIDRSQDDTVTWTGGRSSDVVSIMGTSSVTSTRVAAFFTCLESASAGKFTIPSWVLSAIPPAQQGTLSLGLVNSATFSASGLDFGSISATSSSLRTIAYR